MIKRQVIVLAALVVVLTAVGESTRPAGKRPGNMVLPAEVQASEEPAAAPASAAPVPAAEPAPAENSAPVAPPAPAPVVQPAPQPAPVPKVESLEVEEAAPLEVPEAPVADEPPPALEPVPGDEPAPRVEIAVPPVPERSIQVPVGKDAPAVDVIFEKAEPGAPALKETGPATLEDVLAEMRRLRAEVLRLQQTVDIYSGGLLATVQEENRKLREQLRGAYQTGAVSVPPVPAPDRALLQEVLQEAGGAGADAGAISPEGVAAAGGVVPGAVPVVTTQPVAASPEPLAATDAPAEEKPKKAEKPYEVVSEWGRSPEEAKSMQPAKASLKGLIGWVKPGTDDEALTALGRKLRKELDAYDNLNIEIFDSEKAAHEFKGGREGGEHRVLSISKYRDSSRDVILLIRGEIVQEIPREP